MPFTGPLRVRTCCHVPARPCGRARGREHAPRRPAPPDARRAAPQDTLCKGGDCIIAVGHPCIPEADEEEAAEAPAGPPPARPDLETDLGPDPNVGAEAPGAAQHVLAALLRRAAASLDVQRHKLRRSLDARTGAGARPPGSAVPLIWPAPRRPLSCARHRMSSLPRSGCSRAEAQCVRVARQGGGRRCGCPPMRRAPQPSAR